jgi:hypothetical protein
MCSFTASVKKLRVLVSGALLFTMLGTAAVASAQSDRGTLQGIVKDPTGAVVPGAQVEIRHLATNTVTSITTNDVGLFTAPNLPLGDYLLLVTKDGFGPATADGINLRSGVQIRVDLTLSPAGVTETVAVSASALDSSTITNTTALSEKLVEELPVIVAANKRDITGFLQNLPGFTGGTTFNPRANGANVGETEVFVDGGRASQAISRGSLAENGPSLEQVGEFSVVSNGFNAEYGGFGIWFSNVTIKSGANKFSGSVFDHYGTDAMNARTFFQAEKTDYKQHEGGFTLGGPVVLPGYNGRNKTFFFGSMGIFYSRVGSAGNLITVPTEAFKRGDFSGLVDAQGRQIPIFDPLTTRPDGNGGFVRDQFPGNQIPANRISQGAAEILGFLPTPDLPGNANNFRNRSSPTWPYYDIYTPIAKVDHNVTDGQRLSVMYQAQIRHRVIWSNGMGPYPEWGQPQVNPIDNTFDQIANSWKVRVNHDYVIKSNLINHVTFSLDRYINRGQNKTVGQGWADTLGIAGIPDDDGAFPAINYSGGVASPANLGRAYDEDWQDFGWGISQSLTWSLGKHTMKFGGEIGQMNVDRFFSGGRAGTFSFSNFTTSQPNSPSFGSWGHSFASFLLGDVSSTNTVIPVETALTLDRYALFAQDEWRATPNLTLSYGLRWDYQPPFREADNQMSTFLPDIANPGAGGIPGALAFASTDLDRYGPSFQDNWRGGVGPRLGVGYMLTDKTNIRASWGLYYGGTGNQNSITPLGYQASPSFQSANNFSPVFNWNTEPFPQAFNYPPDLNPSFANGQPVTYTTRDAARLPLVQSFTVGVAREIGKGLTMDLLYVGSRSSHLGLSGNNTQINYVPIEYLSLGNLLFQPINSAAAQAAGFREPFPGFANQLGANTVAAALKPFPQYTSITANSTRLMEGKARYDSFQVKATQRLTGGLSVVSFYTYMNNKSNTNYTVAYPGEQPLLIDPGTPPHIFSFSWSYDLPFGRERAFLSDSSGVLSAIVSGWRVSGALRYQSGAALTITASNNLAPLGYAIKYANRVAGEDVYRDERSGFDPATDRYLNSAAFAAPAAFALGDTGGPLDYVRGFTQKSEALSLARTFAIGTHRLDVGVDALNPFNFVRWNDPNTNISSGAQFGSVNGTQGARTLQFNVAYKF